MVLNTNQQIFNIDRPLIIIAVSTIAFLGIFASGFLGVINDLFVVVSLVLGFIIVGIAFGVTRNFIVPIALIFIFNTIVIMARFSEFDLSNYFIWFGQGIFIVVVTLIIAFILKKSLTKNRFIIYGAISGLILGISSLIPVFPL